MKFISSLLILPLILSGIVLIKAHWPHDTIDAMVVSNDLSQIFIYTRALLLRSTDGGITWLNIRSFNAFREAYLALSPYTNEVYMYDSGVMYRSGDLIEWEQLPVFACRREYQVNLKRRTTFVSSGALIAGTEGRIYKENSSGSGIGFIEIFQSNNFNNCPALAGVPDSNIVYAGAIDGLYKSTNGGTTWSLVLPITNIIEIKTQQAETFIITTSSICRLNVAETACTDLNLPDVSNADKVRNGSSPPTDLAYYDGSIIVTRANSYAIYRTTNLGNTWQKRVKSTSFNTLGHQPDDAWAFDFSEEFTHVEGNILGTWRGVFSTNNAGSTWTYRDSIRRAITTLSLMKESPENGGGFYLAACTYVDGCYYGRPGNLQPNDGALGAGYYFSMYLSPTYDTDNNLRFERSEQVLFRLQGSTTTQPFLPKINNSMKISIKSIDFSDDWENDGTMYVSGYNLGILKSTDRGQTFTRVFNGDGFGGVTRVILSPNYSIDGIMGCLIDPNINGEEWGIFDDIQYIYISRNYGNNWRRLVWNPQRFRDFVIVNGIPDPIVVAVDVNGLLWSHTTLLDGWYPFERVQDTTFTNVRPLGFGYDGLSVSPDGNTFAAGWVEGGMMFGEISLHQINNRRWALPNPWNPQGEIPTIYARNPPKVDDVFGLRMFTSHIMFSPDYAIDNTIFAADMFSIYRSTNQGRNWVKIFTL